MINDGGWVLGLLCLYTNFAIAVVVQGWRGCPTAWIGAAVEWVALGAVAARPDEVVGLEVGGGELSRECNLPSSSTSEKGGCALTGRFDGRGKVRTRFARRAMPVKRC